MRTFLTLLAIASLGLLVTGCGDDGDDKASGETTTSEESAGITPSTEQATTPEAKPKDDSGGGADKPKQPDDEPEQPSDSGGGGGGNADGGGRDTGDDEQEIASVVDDFYTALVDGDGDTACSLLTSNVKKQLEQAFSQTAQFKGKDCADFLGTIAKSYPDATRDALREVELRDVTVAGESATAKYQAPGTGQTTLPLAREDGSWKVGALGGAPGTP